LMPNLKTITEDPVHIRIRLEKVSHEKQNQISALAHEAALVFFGVPRSWKDGDGYQLDGKTDAAESYEGKGRPISID